MSAFCVESPTYSLPAIANSARRAALWVRVTFFASVLVQVWLVSAGHWTIWPTHTTRYDLQARGFAIGQTHLPVKVDPQHLELPDPYDPKANVVLRHQLDLHDTCLYNRRFYLYWGPLPALLLVPTRFAFGNAHPVGDQYLCFAFVLGIMWMSSLLLLEIRRRHFPESPVWLPAMGLAVASLSTPITCILTRAAVYEVAIVGGQFFLLGGVYLAWRALFGEREASEAGRSTARPMPLFFAGLCLAAAVACRVSLAVAVAAVALIVVLSLVRKMHSSLNSLRRLTAFAMPLVATAISLGWFNYSRFEQWHQFGQKYQLSGANLKAIPSLFGIANLWPGLWSYFLRPLARVDSFPYLVAVPGEGQFPNFITLPPHYESFERITGLLWVMPFLWLVPVVGGVSLVRKVLQLCRSSKTTQLFDHGASVGGTSISWLMTALIVAACLGFGPVLMMIGSAQRYLADFTPPLVIVTMLIVWVWTDSSLAPQRQIRRRLTIVASLAAVTVLVGLLVSIEGYSGHFRFNNPALFQQLSGPIVQDSSNATH